MKRLVLLLSAFVVVAAASAEPFVIIVRHAEKAASGGSDPDLAPAGRARADALARMLKDSGVTTIFASEFKRTQETAAPTAKSTGVVPTIVPAKISRRSFRNYIS
jgi:broad specificity phosphatase PhoE